MISSCSTKKNTALSRFYHNLTAHYNVYFNGNESYKKGETKLYQNLKEDFSDLLPVFRETKADANVLASDMDATIKKSTKVIAFHSITVKPELKKGVVREKDKKFYNKKEYNNWVDDSYFLIGRSHFMKKDYELANMSFRFILKEYPESKIIPEVYIWLARTLIYSKEYKEAEEILQKVKPEKLKKKTRSFYYAVYTDIFIDQAKYEPAIEKLKLALKHSQKKQTKIRYKFLLAQLYQKMGNLSLSLDMYDAVIKMKPPYEFVFNAAINSAGTFEGTSGNEKSIRSRLQKLMKDSKNKDFLDQIYFAIADVDRKTGNMDSAIVNYKRSAQYSVANDKQKAKSYLTIADIFYDRKDYLIAAAYYDTALVLVNETYPNYNQLYSKSKGLGKLVKAINTIQLEDSVQRLAKLPDAERLKIIDKIIAEVRKEEEIKKQQEIDEMSGGANMTEYNNMRNMSNAASEAEQGKWYFYNQTAKSFGEPEFRLKWGNNRKLEDNWRRINKRMVNVGEIDADLEGTDLLDAETGKKKVTDNKSREFYTQNIPENDSMIDASNRRIKDAYMTSGNIYKDNLDEEALSIQQFDQLIKRYPKDIVAAEAAFTLYNLYRNKDNKVMMEYYKSFIIRDFPESIYAMILTNPNYLKEMEEKEKEVSRIYESAYNYYLSKNHAMSLSAIDAGLEKFSKHPYALKYTLLKGMVYGSMGDKLGMRTILNQLIDSAPKSDESELALLMVAQMDVTQPDVKEAVEAKEAIEIYKPGDEEIHFFVISAGTDGDVNQLNFNLVNFNLDFFPQTTFAVVADKIGKSQAVLVKSFKNRAEALNYFDLSMRTPSVIKDIKAASPNIFIITEANYQTLLKDGLDSKYMKFFKGHYAR